VGNVQHDPRTNGRPQEGFVRHAIHATVDEAAHVRQVADEGESAATPLILVGVVILCVVPLVAIVILLALGVADFS
jgi:hypothetical protein